MEDRPELDEEREILWPGPREDPPKEPDEPWAKLADRVKSEDE